MAALSRLGRQLTEVVATFNLMGVHFALIGGLALATHRVVRATQDVDLLTDGRRADEIDSALLKLGYSCLHRSSDAGNYLRGDERLDLLYATRTTARNLLAGAAEVGTAFGALHVVSAEGLIALQPLARSGGVNIRPASHRDPYEALDDLMAAVEALCPRWPTRELFKSSGVWVL